VDLALGATTGTLTLGAPAAGYSVSGLAFSPDGSRLYALWGLLVVIDTATDEILNAIAAGNNVTALAVAPDGSEIYVANAYGYPDFNFSGSVVVVDAASETVTGSINTFALPMSIALHPSGTKAWVSTPWNFVNTGYGAGYLPSPWVAQLDLSATELATGFSAGNPAAGNVVSADGSRLYVTIPSTNSVRVVDTATNAFVTSIPVGTSPSNIAWVPAPKDVKKKVLAPGKQPH
jgi:YVTN family beta-propeller protein